MDEHSLLGDGRRLWKRGGPFRTLGSSKGHSRGYRVQKKGETTVRIL